MLCAKVHISYHSMHGRECAPFSVMYVCICVHNTCHCKSFGWYLKSPSKNNKPGVVQMSFILWNAFYTFRSTHNLCPVLTAPWRRLHHKEQRERWTPLYFGKSEITVVTESDRLCAMCGVIYVLCIQCLNEWILLWMFKGNNLDMFEVLVRIVMELVLEK